MKLFSFVKSFAVDKVILLTDGRTEEWRVTFNASDHFVGI